jgi:hypothetical protein
MTELIAFAAGLASGCVLSAIGWQRLSAAAATAAAKIAALFGARGGN